MKETISLLLPEEVITLKNEFDLFLFRNDFDLVYQDHIPTAGIALIEGRIELIKNSKVLKTISPPQILGIKNLISHIPVSYGYRVKANSQIILIGKSQILKRLEDQKSTLFSLLVSLS